MDQVVSGPRTRSATATPSRRSLKGLDLLNFLMADVQNGVGPYLSAFLAGTRHWQAGAIGIAMAASALSSGIAQVPAGLLVDSMRYKRALTAISGLVIALGCLAIVWFHGFWPIVSAQIMLGIASALVPPALAALSLGLVGQSRIAARISRNESYNHGGSFVAAGLAGLAGQYVGVNWIFYLVCIFAIGSAFAARMIVADEIDHEVARGGEDGATHQPARLGELFRRRDIIVYLCAIALFHLGNAAMLPLAGQELGKRYPGSDTMALSACVISAQLVMVGAAWGVGRAGAAGIGRKTIFLVAYAILPVRGVLFSMFDTPVAVVTIQLLDGVAAGVFSVISIIVAADLTRGTGRFNVVQGVVALCVSLGAAVSNAMGGILVQSLGFSKTFLALAAAAGVAFLFFLLLMPETRPSAEGLQPSAA